MSSAVFRFLAMLAVAVFISGCKLAVVVGPGGTVQSTSDTRNCPQNNTCEFEVNEANFKDTFTAVPLPGYEFAGWKTGPTNLCLKAKDPTCPLSNTVFKDVPKILAIIGSDAVFTISPLFKSIAGAKLVVKDADGKVLGEVMELKNGTDAGVRQVFKEKNGDEHGYMVDVNRMYLNDSHGYTVYWLNSTCTGKVVYAPSPLVLEPLFSNRYLVARREKSQMNSLLLLKLSPPEKAKIHVDTYAVEDGICKQITTKYPLVEASIQDEDYSSRYTPPFGVYSE
jgi:hypothetical protein